MKRLLPVLLLVLFAAGCRSQQPVSTFGISYTATAPASCTTASPCQIEYSDTHGSLRVTRNFIIQAAVK